MFCTIQHKTALTISVLIQAVVIAQILSVIEEVRVAR